MRRTVMIMAGGTGGHIFPGLEIARALQAQGHFVCWLGSAGRMETRLVPEAGIDLDTVTIDGLRGKGRLSLLAAPWRLLKATLQARRIIRRRRPDVILGLGGFASGPGGLAARWLGVPLYVHEQNAIAGVTNRVLSRWARRTLAAFPGAFPEPQAVSVVGNPVREAIRQLPAPVLDPARAVQSLGDTAAHPPRLLVVGGSLGAQVLNEQVPKALAQLAASLRPEVRHQAGRDKDEVTRQAYCDAGVEAQVSDFIGDMAAAFAWADLVICRAGALTVSELACAGVASILVPLPIAVDDHQTMNARFLSEGGAAILMPQPELVQGALIPTLQGLLADTDRLHDMALKARALARPDATDAVIEAILEEF
ncbi:undecaprenyldiphospho-muramoylpentapeptide beta-N-acetylglucosaminyltransferase [Terasakiispira papahanaumokuakeensis]|uniref:UDP-N-acetylglucosamine--N-acetylmuramyl-(pentapeptide) pyrophosphoryl-undecaprenol N-acetylglucosamine transferase n=1 Tax=Terasakiispira papahanaumokuakeensis TaxID=197479 RepID=A0A1E2V6S0_9GAMM|nr:undecaprenyldiphospho-muramoylpentapeptide beta-N-acetylglucosaminyltransferase [Terasakiispira papahanaumokuakeensis]ODC02699.1 undecaprenyldiphospho-muramoylpentapeptide beta-N-acetylglucosaminyltransferase [Terasakiispira papahanaumokuakeensis]